MLTLGLESTCDETSWALVEDGVEIISHIVASQSDLHALYGGVVPEIACRRHIDVLVPLLHQTLKAVDRDLRDVDLIACAVGPGLVGALLIGATAAKTLAIALQKPFVAVHHIEAHLFAALMPENPDRLIGQAGLILSGGHTLLTRVHQLGDYRILGQTVDDAIGESFDKVAVMLGLTYPGGHQIEQLALQGDPLAFPFKAAKLKRRNLDVSYSGLKTAVWHAIAQLGGVDRLGHRGKCDIAASFQRAAVETISAQLTRFIESCSPASRPTRLYLGGGVIRNRFLKRALQTALPSLSLVAPADELCSDNAAMIAALGYHRHRQNGLSDLQFPVMPKWSLEKCSKGPQGR